MKPANPRPTSAPEVGGTTKVVGMNLLNFFNTLRCAMPPPGCFPSGTDADCRGATSQAEFDRQWPKTVAAIVAMDADVVGFNEIENDGYGPDSSIAFLVDKLNAATAPGTYAFIDADAGTGQVNALGTDAIKVGMIYKPARVTPVGQTAVLNTVAFVNGGDSAPRNRPSLVQAFQVNATGARFIVDINHLKSKGSACDAPDAGDGQGNCNQVRVNAVNELLELVRHRPDRHRRPRHPDARRLELLRHGRPDHRASKRRLHQPGRSFVGPDAYSYVFDGQWGYLDHALGSASLTAQVTGVADYHINADEPSVLDYNTDFKTAGQLISLYAPDQFRISDHDPVMVGLNPNAPAHRGRGRPVLRQRRQIGYAYCHRLRPEWRQPHLRLGPRQQRHLRDPRPECVHSLAATLDGPSSYTVKVKPPIRWALRWIHRNCQRSQCCPNRYGFVRCQQRELRSQQRHPQLSASPILAWRIHTQP